MRGFIRQFLVFCVVVGIMSFSEQVSCDRNEYPEVATDLGNIKGSNMVSHHGKPFFAFRGIRYAQPPVGELRFKVSLFIATQYCSLIKYLLHSGSFLASRTSVSVGRHIRRYR